MGVLTILQDYLDEGCLLHGSPNIGITKLEPRRAVYRGDAACGVFATDMVRIAIGCAVIAKRCYANCITDIDNPLFFDSFGFGRVYVCPPDTFVAYDGAFISYVPVEWIDTCFINPRHPEIFTMLFGDVLLVSPTVSTPVHGL